MSDKLVFDLAQEVEGTPNVFVRKDWINILDNQNQNYNNNQSVIDTSQLSNSNKYMSYREAYFLMPLVLSLITTGNTTGTTAGTYASLTPLTANYAVDKAIGLKNWFGQIIHSFTLDYNGTTIIQQTPYVNIWNSFKLMTSLSYSDIITQGSTIGFFPDDPTSWIYYAPGVVSPSGTGVCNNTAIINTASTCVQYNNFRSGRGNTGYASRLNINFEGDATTGQFCQVPGSSYTSMLNGGVANAAKQVWKGYVFNKINQGNNTAGVWQCAIMATIYLKHVHSFFNMCPLLKGVFMKMTMNLNNTTTSFVAVSTGNATNATFPYALAGISVSNPLGGVNPIMITSGDQSGVSFIDSKYTVATLAISAQNPGSNLFPIATNGTYSSQGYKANVSVGAVCLDQSMNLGNSKSTLAQSVYLYIPAYTFNPVFEQAYLSSPVKQIKYTDIYQYQVLAVASGQTFNNLLTNGIANIKSVLVLPFYSPSAGTAVASGVPAAAASNASLVGANTAFVSGSPVWQSPFDCAGTGPTSPMCWLSNFNIQVSGQNAIYNLERYNFEQWNNQLYGQNAVNGGLTDGLTSGLIDRLAFDMSYNYYYVNVERMLPVEQSVPKSIQVIGQNYSINALDLYCFIEYGVDISIDALTGARV